MRYIALLRGINVGGNNKVPMTDLRDCFISAGYKNVSTYINSGNVIFESTEKDTAKLVNRCQQAINKQFGLEIICAVISADSLINALAKAPKWWNQGPAKHNAIFVIEPCRADDVIAEMGEVKPDYEKVNAVQPVIFWSAPIETFSRTRYSKIVGSRLYKSVTIRNANTTLKLAELSRK